MAERKVKTALERMEINFFTPFHGNEKMGHKDRHSRL